MANEIQKKRMYRVYYFYKDKVSLLLLKLEGWGFHDPVLLFLDKLQGQKPFLVFGL